MRASPSFAAAKASDPPLFVKPVFWGPAVAGEDATAPGFVFVEGGGLRAVPEESTGIAPTAGAEPWEDRLPFAGSSPLVFSWEVPAAWGAEEGKGLAASSDVEWFAAASEVADAGASRIPDERFRAASLSSASDMEAEGFAAGFSPLHPDRWYLEDCFYLRVVEVEKQHRHRHHRRRQMFVSAWSYEIRFSEIRVISPSNKGLCTGLYTA